MHCVLGYIILKGTVIVNSTSFTRNEEDKKCLPIKFNTATQTGFKIEKKKCDLFLCVNLCEVEKRSSRVFYFTCDEEKGSVSHCNIFRVVVVFFSFETLTGINAVHGWEVKPCECRSCLCVSVQGWVKSETQCTM